MPACLRVWAPRAAGTSLLAVLLSRAPGSLGLPALGLWVPRDRSSRSQKWGGGAPASRWNVSLGAAGPQSRGDVGAPHSSDPTWWSPPADLAFPDPSWIARQGLHPAGPPTCVCQLSC